MLRRPLHSATKKEFHNKAGEGKESGAGRGGWKQGSEKGSKKDKEGRAFGVKERGKK